MPPVTVPTSWFTVREVALATTHDSVVVCPAIIDAGFAPKELIMGSAGGKVVAFTLGDCADELPAGSWAFTA